MNAIEIKDMRKTFRDHTVFDHFSLNVQEGEFLAITGRSGSGKSTLLNIIGLLDTMDSGELTLLGYRDPVIDSRIGRMLLRDQISYLFQNYGLIDERTVKANLNIAAYARPDGKAEKSEAMAKALKAVGLSGYEKKHVYELSGGEQQRVAIAKLLVKPARLILADEPTGSLDPDNRTLVLSFLRRLHEEGKTVLVVTHDGEVAKCADRVVEL